MSEFDWQKVETIVDEALDLPEEHRPTFIEQKCSNNEELKSEVTQLLESIFESEGWLDNPTDYKKEFYEEVSDEIEHITTAESLVGQQVGPYVIKEILGEGGMGTVYMAERADEEFDHKVAIKIIRHGRATKSNIRRFKREQQILANLNHPGIAQLFDGGITQDGFPYIIMEYVDGLPIDQYCKKYSLDIDAKITLFKQVLKAVRYAHENLIIHRDLKPGNILIDDEGKVKILDFGISKLLEDEREDTLTITGSRLLTPRYAAPEQVRQENSTTATDLYALGIMFYQLLAGTHPFDFDQLSRYEIEQTIIKQEADKPSSKVDDTKTQKKLRGDLDAIALKAIRKEYEHRYRMANEFLDDLKNYQNGIPVTAREGSLRYRSQKFFKRNKQRIAIAAGVLILLFSISGFYTWRLAQERNQAQFQAKRAEQVKSFMLQMFNTGNPDMKSYSGKDAKVKDLLLAGYHRTERELQGESEIYIDMLSAIGDALSNIDEFETSEEALTKALAKSLAYYGKISSQTATIHSHLCNYYHEVHKYDLAEKHIRKAIDIQKQLNGNRSLELAGYFSIYASNQFLQSHYKQAEKLFLKSDSLRKIYNKTQNISYYITLANLGETQLFLGKYDLAEANFKKALSYFEEYYEHSHPEIARTKYRMGLLYHRTSKHKKAETYLLQSMNEFTQLKGSNSSDLSANYALLARNYRVLGNWEKAEKYALKDIELTNTIYGDSSVIYAKSINNFAIIQKAQGNLRKAKINYQKSLSIYRKKVDNTNPDLAIPMYNLGDVLKDLGEYTKAQRLLEQVISIDEKRFGKEHPEVGLDLNKLGAILLEAKQYNKADSIFIKAQPIYENHFPEDHYRIGEFYMNIGTLKYYQNRYSLAEDYFSKAISVFRKNFDEENTRVQEALKYIEKVKEKVSS
ncbi:serine/threonine-protein kinase [Fodinibius halophilus]|uniref:Serine/threonine protein kinase n=1 Tax=Fodinibius halophilus TaxID=1736908 RepID=A0A6M1T748_9BACT|nr:serine/threonine-protein kinase [Fodinibius halophilus]NGP87004.1 serine/threonine protein kinase [Fodinibius halophilus]